MQTLLIFIGIAVCLALIALAFIPLRSNGSSFEGAGQAKTTKIFKSERHSEPLSENQINLVMGRLNKLLSMRWTKKRVGIHELGICGESNHSFDSTPYEPSIGFFSMWELVCEKLTDENVEFKFYRTHGGTVEGNAHIRPQADIYNPSGGVCMFQVVELIRAPTPEKAPLPTKPLRELPLSEVTAIDAITYGHPGICDKKLSEAAGSMVSPPHEWMISRTGQGYNYRKGTVVFDMGFEAIASVYSRENPDVVFKSTVW